MRRVLLLAAALWCAVAYPAAAATLLSLSITTALSATGGTVYQVRGGPPRNLTVQAKLAYGSGGTTADAYLQTTLDGGTTWIDVANFHFTTAAAVKVINLSAATPVTSQVTPADGALAANTVVDGILGSQFRVKYASTGTYAATTLTVTISNVGVTP